MPVNRLYLCGSDAHPGVDVTGMPGHHAGAGVGKMAFVDWLQSRCSSATRIDCTRPGGEPLAERLEQVFTDKVMWRWDR